MFLQLYLVEPDST